MHHRLRYVTIRRTKTHSCLLFLYAPIPILKVTQKLKLLEGYCRVVDILNRVKVSKDDYKSEKECLETKVQGLQSEIDMADSGGKARLALFKGDVHLWLKNLTQLAVVNKWDDDQA